MRSAQPIVSNQDQCLGPATTARSRAARSIALYQRFREGTIDESDDDDDDFKPDAGDQDSTTSDDFEDDLVRVYNANAGVCACLSVDDQCLT
jgi:hypothetical protein